MPRIPPVMSMIAPPATTARSRRPASRVRYPSKVERARPPRAAMKVLLLTPYPSACAPSQRFRFEQYIKPLASFGYNLELRPLLRPQEHSLLYQPGATAKKVRAVCHGAA